MIYAGNIYTHGGIFHADDVFAYAAIKLAGIVGALKRVNYLPTDISDADIVFDIGGGKFDHHQNNSEIRENGVPYAAFGLIVREYKAELSLDDDTYNYLDATFIQKIDAYDNGINEEPNILSNAISCFIPTWEEPDADMDVAFVKASDIAVEILRREIVSAHSITAVKKIAESLTADDVFHHTVFLDRYMPISGYLREFADVEWIAFPSKRGGWQIASVPGVDVRNKALMPEQFRGNTNLPKGMHFCHKAGFIAGFDTEEDARAFAAEWL